MTNLPSPDDVVRVRGLTKSYGQQRVLRGIDLDVHRGETLAVLGPNGAGKSTTIEILEGFRRPGGGEVRVLGEQPSGAPRSWRARIGVVAQTGGEHGPYTVREVLTQFASFFPAPRGVDEVLGLAGLAGVERKRVSALSGGQQRRVDVALGIVGSPELLFLDEPTTGFDPEARQLFWAMIETLKAEGTTILLTTHYLEEAARLADRIGVVRGGALIALGAPDTIGGAEARLPRVSWRSADGVRHEERTEHPAALVARLSDKGTAEPAGLEVRRPSLEEIYLDLLAAGSADDDTDESTEEAAA